MFLQFYILYYPSLLIRAIIHAMFVSRGPRLQCRLSSTGYVPLFAAFRVLILERLRQCSLLMIVCLALNLEKKEPQSLINCVGEIPEDIPCF